MLAYQTRRVKLLLARPTDHLGQGKVRAVDDTKADHAVFNAREVLVQVTLPQEKTIKQGAILMGKP